VNVEGITHQTGKYLQIQSFEQNDKTQGEEIRKKRAITFDTQIYSNVQVG
jgi:hypothetical protein